MSISSQDSYILGISAFYHDSAACLIKNGRILAAAQEERFTRQKHDASFPNNAINYCLKEAGVGIQEMAYVAYYEKPFIKFERLLMTYLTYAPRGLRSFLKAMPVWLKQKLFLKDYIAKELGYNGKIIFTDHHESHAASAFFPSPFQKSAILTMDGVGEWTTTSYGVGDGHTLQLDADITFPHSLGLLYSAFTYYVGFRVNSGEYKLMGLAPYGEPKYVNDIKRDLIDIKPDGSFKLNMAYFNYCAGLTMINERFETLFGRPARRPETQIDQFYMDVAASIQAVTEEVMVKMANHVQDVTGCKNLCLAGGVALNCVGNGEILRQSQFDHVWIQPAAGDAGGALGAALFTWHRYLDQSREVDGIHDLQSGSYLGTAYDSDEIEQTLQDAGAVYEKVSDEDLPRRVAEIIAAEKVVGLHQGRMEFGPRALGARSILGDARSEKMQTTINLKIKFRESFRPFAPSVLQERSHEFFDLESESPYMLLVAGVKEDKILPESKNTDKQGIEKLKVKRSDIPAVTHVDYSARVQTVTKERNGLYYDIIKEFERMTGCPAIINTSFNIRGEPIVNTPHDAYRCFMCTHMDYLIVGRFILNKENQPNQDQWKKDDITQYLD